MSHVDDGLLHAYLDGALLAEDPARAADVEAHLAVCDDCQARLRQAEALKAEADALLELAAPPMEAAPAFEEIVARAEAAERAGPDAGTAAGATASPARRPRPSAAAWTRRLAWAASVVIALGMGWWARELAYAPDSPMLEPRPAPVEQPPRAAPAVDAATPEAMATADEAQDRPAGVSEAAPAPAAPVMAAPEAAGAGAAERSTQQAAAPRDAVRDVAAALEPGAAEQRAAPAPTEAVARTAAETRTVPAAYQEALALDAVVVTGVPGPAPATLERWLGGPLWGIRGLAHLERDTLNIGGVAAVRIRQALPDGGSIELLELRPDRSGREDAAVSGYLSGIAASKTAPGARQAAAPRAATPAASGVTLDPGRFGGTTIVATAALPADSIRALLERLERLP